MLATVTQSIRQFEMRTLNANYFANAHCFWAHLSGRRLHYVFGRQIAVSFTMIRCCSRFSIHIALRLAVYVYWLSHPLTDKDDPVRHSTLAQLHRHPTGIDVSDFLLRIVDCCNKTSFLSKKYPSGLKILRLGQDSWYFTLWRFREILFALS